jgi:hypothetical protein
MASSCGKEDDEDILRCRKPINIQMIRDEVGNVLPGGLRIILKDFGLPDELRRRYPAADLERELVISYEELADSARQGDLEQEGQDEEPFAPQNMRKHLLSPLSEEEVASSDERESKRRETRAEKFAEAGDSDYCP